MTTFYLVVLAIFIVSVAVGVILVARIAKETAKADSKWKDYVLVDSIRHEDERNSRASVRTDHAEVK